VKMLGSDQRIRWSQTETGMVIKNPVKLPEWQVIGFKIEFKASK
jgi:alpha-L-fucosidase